MDCLPDKYCVIAYISQFLCFISPPKVDDKETDNPIAAATSVSLGFPAGTRTFSRELDVVYPYMEWLYKLMSDRRFLSVIDEKEDANQKDEDDENLPNDFAVLNPIMLNYSHYLF